MKRSILRVLFLVICLVAIGGGGAFLLYNGFLRFSYPSFDKYPVQGVDVSNHQSDIDWDKLDKKQVQFALIKATEGGDFKDKSFAKNWENARREGIVVGAYHFFTFCKSGEEQARNFIESVPSLPNTLPPAIDLEYSGNCKLTKTKEELLFDIETFIRIVEDHYQKRMIIYVLGHFYNEYLVGKFLDNPLWLRDVYGEPSIIDNRDWLFWQHSNRGRLQGIDVLVDLNVYKGTREQFRELLTSSKLYDNEAW